MRNLPPELEAALFEKQVVFVRGRLDEAVANAIIAQLLLISRTATGKPVEMHIDSPGGILGAALSVYDMMQMLGVAVSTTCVGTAGGATVLLLAGGTSGQRFALPHARVHLMDESVALQGLRAADLAAGAEAIKAQSVRWRAALLKHLRVPHDELVRELSAPRWLTAQEAQGLGLIDSVVAQAPRG